jgi:tripartite-type tricarboxylate transporter receptor subunit TctC
VYASERLAWSRLNAQIAKVNSLLRLLVFAGLGFQASVAVCQAYPAKPIRLVVPFPPGAGIDILTRLIGQRLGEALGNKLVIDNRAGGSGIAGSEIVAKSSPDGYTLLMATGGILTVLPFLKKNVLYSTIQDFAPITLVAATSNVLVVPPSLPAKSVGELIAMARSRPGTINYASTGIGTGSHLAAELFRLQAQVNIVHVPYQGSAQALTDLIAGRVQIFFNNALSAMPQVRSGKLRALAVTGPVRLAIAPEVPTVAESGLPGFETETWYGMLAPAGTPPALISRLHADVVKVIHLPEVQERFTGEATRAIGNTPGQFRAYILAESTKWQKVLAASGIRAD